MSALFRLSATAMLPLAGLLLAIGCGGGDKGEEGDPDGGARYHPAGWSAPDVHGLAAKMQEQTCTACHGADLLGGRGPSCDTCHSEGWRSDCTFCHGGTADSTGAPPRDIDGADTDLSFPDHTVHVSAVTHADWGCAACHARPADILTPGHIFIGDDSPGVAEADLSGGLSAAGEYAGAGSCSNLYCHGDGAGVLGSVSTGEDLDCGGCHGDAAAADRLSGSHAAHIAVDLVCADCHATASQSDAIAQPAAHVDGDVDVDLPATIARDGDRCTGACHGADHVEADWPTVAWHPPGWDDPGAHGQAAKQQTQTCTDCHGADLSGGARAPACDTCHTAGWRTDCTYCHGGDLDSTGAPPEDIDDRSTDLSFAAHTEHVTRGDHAAWGCETCHVMPADILSPSHIFVGDTSPGLAEVDLRAGLSPAGDWISPSCSNLYCHGDGGANLGTVDDGEVMACDSCHGSDTNPRTLSTLHSQHLDAGATCEECHGATAIDSSAISDPDLHVDGAVETAFGSGMVYSAGTCAGTCHGLEHSGADWASGAWHPTGWDDPTAHGLSANLQLQVCTDCHGADLTGGSSGQSCDTCHTAGWRSDCTYCHGGGANSTGAPPEDIDNSSTSLSFAGHTEHVTRTDHPAYDCDTCHDKPSDVLSPGHVAVGDPTAGRAELDFTAGLSPAATATTGTCSNLYCHGDGRSTLGTVSDGATLTCASCHGDASSGTLTSGEHRRHLRRGLTCNECHDTAASGSSIALPDQHVNGSVETAFTSGIIYTPPGCYGVCHGEEHFDGETW